MAVRPGNDTPRGSRKTAEAAANHAEAQRLHALLEPTLSAHGLYLEDVEIRMAGSQRTVHVVVDLPEDQTGGVGLDRIAEVSTALSETLDADPQDAGRAYNLEVSSPGVTRPLTQPRHWRRARGRMIRIKLRGGGDDVIGRLLEVADDGVTVLPELPVKKGMKAKQGDPLRLPFEQIRKAMVEVEFVHSDDPAELAGDPEDPDLQDPDLDPEDADDGTVDGGDTATIDKPTAEEA